MSDTVKSQNISSAAEFDARLKTIDETRWLASRYAAPEARRRLVAIYSLNVELTRALQVSEPMLGKIRIQWWREALEEVTAGRKPRRHDLCMEIDDLFGGERAVLGGVSGLLDAYDDILDDHMAGEAASHAHAERHASAASALGRLAGLALRSDADATHLDRIGGACAHGVQALAEEAASGANGALEELPDWSWPAVAHLAAEISAAKTGRDGPLLRRWRVFRAVLTQKI